MPGKRYSRQRELIYQAVQGSDQHPTAEMVYQWLKPDNPNLSLGTVYRNLNLLSEEGILTRMPFPVERYDAVTEPHSHFRCKSCGQVFDFDHFDLTAPQLRALDDAAEAAQPGFLVERHELTFTGLCPACRKRQQSCDRPSQDT